MTTHTALLLLVLVAAATSAPLADTTQLCSTECPVAASKLSFIPGTTYSYTYTGKSTVQLKGVDGGQVETRWEKEVLLTILGPCDVAISLKGTKVDGETGLPGVDKLEKYPLVLAITDGRVQRVCSHADDDTQAINFKKGVASTMQISLPSFSITNSGLNFTETDIVGTCPTRYQVETEATKVKVTKEKDHRQCQEHYQTPAETSLPYLMGPLPMQESKSVCTLEVESGIISSVKCEDKKVVKASYGVYKYVEAKEVSTLSLTSREAPTPDTISHITQENLVPGTLRYDYTTPKKDPTLVPQLEQTLQYLCKITKDGVHADSAAALDEVVHLLRRIPEESFKDIYNKVTRQQICQEHNKLKSLYMDAIAFVHEPESVEVMVKELVEGRATGVLAALYSNAFYSIARPNEKSIQGLEPLFKAQRPDLLKAKLAASSMVNTYCRHKLNCSSDSSVKKVVEALKQIVEQDLLSSSTEQTEMQALNAFKSLGNIGVMTPEAAAVVLRYIRSENKKVNIRVAAAQAFRMVKCHRSVTLQLLDYTFGPGHNTEVRIAAYLAALPSVNSEDMQNIVTTISNQENTQVRGFILSHLHNLQQSNNPGKERLRYMLLNIVLPQDFEADLRKYSRNLDLSYFSSSLGFGAEVESNIIYQAGSYIPRSVNLNMTAGVDGNGNPINIGEIGGRIEGLEHILPHFIGPASYFQTSSYSKMFHDLISFIQKKWSTIQQELGVFIREGRAIDYAALESIISKLYDPESVTLAGDLFLRFLGQEISYASQSMRLQDINTDHMIQAFIRYLMQTLNSMKNTNLNVARAAHLGVDYSFTTIQGTPLKINIEGMVVGGMKMETNLNNIFSGQGASGSFLKILPSFSVQTHGFIGYDAHIVKNGLKLNTTISSINGVAVKVSGQSGQELQIEVDIPDKMEVVEIQSETYLMKRKRNQPETKILPPSIHDPRILSKSCLSSFESVLGLKVCYDIDVPDIFRANSLPLGSPTLVKISVNKTESTIKGYKIAISTISEGSQALKFVGKVSVLGSSTSKESHIELTLKQERESYLADFKLQSSVTSGEAKATIVNSSQYKSLQTNVSFITNGVEYSRAVMVEIKVSPAGNGKKYQMNIYRSLSRHISPESIIFTGELTKSYMTRGIKVDLSAMTKENLMQYLPFNLQVSGDFIYYSVIPLPMRLHKFELETGLGSWKLTSFIRKSGDSSPNIDYSSGFLVVHQGQTVIDLRAILQIQGTMAVDFKEELFVKAKFGYAEYKMQQTIEYQQTKMAVNMQVTRQNDNMKLIEIVAEKNLQDIKFIYLIQLPEYMESIKVAAGAVRQGQDYNAEAVITRGHRVLLQLQGPVTFIMSPTLTKLGTNIKINNIYQLISSLEFSEGNHAVLLAVKNQERVLISMEGSLNTPSGQSPVLKTRIILPVLIDSKFEASISEDILHVSINNLLLPRSPSPRRIKAFLDINWNSRQGQAMVLWDADRDSSKKIAVDAIILPQSGSQDQATIVHVKTTLLERTYNTNMKVVAPFLLHQYRKKNSISMEVETPEREKWMLEIGTLGQSDTTGSVEVTFRSTNNNVYHLICDLDFQYLDGPFSFKVKAGLSYTSPQNRRSQFSLEAKHQYESSSQRRRIIQLLMDASTPSMQTPLKMKLLTLIQDYLSTINLESEGNGRSETLFKWQLKTYEQGGLKELDISYDLKAIVNTLKKMTTLVGLGSGPLTVTAYENGTSSAYRWHYNRGYDTHTITMEAPSRTVEAEATYSPYKTGIKVYPNKARSDEVYEVTGEHMEGSWGGRSKYQGRMRHPMLSKDMKAVLEYTRSSSSSSSGGGGGIQTGSFELDIFPDTADKITGTVSSVFRANNTLVIEANLSTRVLRVKPRVTLEVSLTPHTAAVNLTFQEEPTSPVSLHIHGKYDLISRNHSAVAFYLASDGNPVVDFTGTTEPRIEPYCDGVALLANVRTSVLGNLVVNSTLCRPAYLEMVVTKQDTNKVYKVKIGVQSPYKAEVSISETDQLQVKEEYLSLIGIELVSPRRVKFDFEYKPDKMMSLKDYVLEEELMLVEAFLSWTDRLYREVERQAHQAGVPFPAPTVRALVEEAWNDITKIYADVIYSDLLSVLDAIMKLLQQPTVSFIRNVSYQTLQDMAHMQREYALNMKQQIMELKQLVQPAVREITEVVVEGAKWLQTGEEPEMVRQLMEYVQRTAIYHTLNINIIEPIKETYPQQYQVTMDVIARIIDTFRTDLLMMEQKVWASPTLRRIILKAIDLTQEDTLLNSLEWLESQVTQWLLLVAPEPGTYRFGVQVPLYQPVYSLMQVIKMPLESRPSFTEKVLLSADSLTPIPVSKMLETYYGWMPTSLCSTIKPLNRSALVVNGTEILTFDGTLLRAPRSACKVLLASVPGVASVYLSHPQSSPEPEITFQYRSTKATIKPNLEVDVDGRQVHGRQTLGDLVVEVTPRYVTLVSPLMGVHRMKEERVVMVNMSSWAFNHTKGLLGLYDNERANDRMMKDGRNATNLRDLVQSWQENPRCPTPPISPINPSQVTVKESVMCDVLFFPLKPCTPVVSPKPFLQRCRLDRSPLDAARSYQSFCRMHGVKFPLAIF